MPKVVGITALSPKRRKLTKHVFMIVSQPSSLGRTGLDGTRLDGMEQYGTGWNETGRNGTELDGRVQYGTGLDGTKRYETQ